MRTAPEDVAYVLAVVNEFFPSARLWEGDILSTWAGVRPLISNGHGAASDISRAHEIRNPEPNWWDVAGGKLTTYRLMAEQTVDQIVARKRRAAAKCATAVEPLLSAAETEGVSGILPPPFGKEAVAHYCRKEWAIHLDDVMARRTSWQHYYADAAQKAAQVAEWMGEFLGWSAGDAAREVERCQATIQNKAPRRLAC